MTGNLTQKIPVILLAYHFPPLGGVAVMRALRFCRYLRDYGFEPSVVCVEPHPNVGEPRDSELSQEIPPGVRVVRVGCLEPENYRNSWDYPWEKIRRNLFKTFDFLLMPDDRALWVRPASHAVMNLAKEIGAKLIWATAQPFSTLVAGMMASHKLRIPLVSDFRDDWTTSSALFRRNEPARLAKERQLEQKVLGASAAVVTVTPGIVEALKTRSPYPDRVHFLPNGFDPAHYPKGPDRKSTEDTGTLILCHTGGIYQHRSPEPVFRLMERLSHSRPNLKVVARFMGRVDRDSQHHFDSTWPGIVENLGFCNHTQVRQALMNSDLNLLILERVERAEWLYTGKVFDYLGAGRPILMFGPVHSPLADMIRQSGLGECVDWDDLAGAERFVLDLLENPRQPNQQIIDQFDARQQTGRLALIFRNALST